MTASVYERSARERKVLRLLRALPLWMTSDLLDVMLPEERERFAVLAGCNPPSETTWSLLTETVRARESLTKRSA